MSIKKIALASIAVLVLAGCSSSPKADTTTTATDTYVTPAPEPAPAPEPVLSDEETYLAALHSIGDPIIEANSDADLLDVAYTICGTLADGNTVTDLITYLYTSGSIDTENAATAGELVAGAVYVFCPEYTSQLDAFSAQYAS